MTIFEKHPEFSKGKLTMMLGRISRLFDSGKTADQIAEEIHQPIELVNELIEIKKESR